MLINIRGKISNTLDKIILSLLLLMVGYVITQAVFQYSRNGEKFSPLILLVGTCIYLLFVFACHKKVKETKLSDKRLTQIAYGVIAITTISYFVVAKLITVVPMMDLTHIITEAVKMLSAEDHKIQNIKYFSRYPNNIPILLLFYYSYRAAALVGITDLALVGNIIGTVSLGIMLLFSFLAVKRMRGVRTGFLVIIFLVLSPIYFYYASYPYTDICSMSFASIGLYLLVCAIQKERGLYSYVMMLAAYVLLFIGYKIRPTTVFLCIAITMWMILSQKKKVILKSVSSMILVFVLCSVGFGCLQNVYITIDQNIKFPATHWVMMGLNSEVNGKFNLSDFKLTDEMDTYEKKVQANTEEIKKRVNELGAYGLIKHLCNKLNVVWADGYAINETWKSCRNHGSLYDYMIGNKNIFMCYLIQISRISILVLFWGYCLRRMLCKGQDGITPLLTAIFGGFLFYLLWETLARYSISFMPWLVMWIAYESAEKVELPKALSDKKEKYLVRMSERILFVGSIALVIITIGIWSVNLKEFTQEKSKVKDTVIWQNNGSVASKCAIIGKNVIKQQFKTKLEFNEINLFFDTSSAKTVTDYEAEVYEDQKLIAKKKFTSDSIGNKPLAISWNNKENKASEKNKNYVVQIKSLNATNKDTLRVYVSGITQLYQGYWLKVNEKSYDRNIKMFVYNATTRTYTSIRLYGIIGAGILSILLFSLAVLNPYKGGRQKRLPIDEIETSDVLYT